MTDATPGGDPIARFLALLEEAKRVPREILPEPTAFALATVDERGAPSARIVLLKNVDERGFVFYTNHESRKGRELLATRRAALCFHWQPMEVQVRVEGTADTVSAEEADAYFASRARGSQIGAWASRQSRTIEHAGRPRGTRRGGGGTIRARTRAPAAAVVRIPRRSEPYRVLERTAEPPAYSRRVRAGR